MISKLALAAFGAFTIAGTAQSAPGDITCIYDNTPPLTWVQVGTGLVDGSMTVEKANEMVRPAIGACIAEKQWTHPDQRDMSFLHAITRAQMKVDRNLLQGGGIDPDAILALYPQLDQKKMNAPGDSSPEAEVARLERDTYLGDFVKTKTKAKVAPYAGAAGVLLMEQHWLLGYERNFAAIK